MRNFRIEILEDGQHLIFFELLANDDKDLSNEIERIRSQFEAKENITIKAIETDEEN